MSNRTILVVEDEFLIRLTLVEALADDGFEVLEAATATEALDVLRDAGQIGLLLTDIQLPGGLDGFALAREARAKMPDLSVIYLTGNPHPTVGNADNGREETIAKPYLPSDVSAAARRMLGE